MQRLVWAPVLLLAACAQSPSDILDAMRARTSSVDRVTFVATTYIPSNPAPTTTADVHGADASAVCDATLALPLPPQGFRSCPADFGIVYHLAFFAGTEPVLAADADPNGCREITLDGPEGKVTVDGYDPAYWTTFEATIGVPP